MAKLKPLTIDEMDKETEETQEQRMWRKTFEETQRQCEKFYMGC